MIKRLLPRFLVAPCIFYILSFIFLVLFFAFSNSVYALALTTDSAGNAYDFNSTSINSENIENDLLWAGDDVVISDTSVAGDILIAGDEITINKSKASGSVRAACGSLTLNKTKVARNVTAFSGSAFIGTETSLAALDIFASQVEFYGSAMSMSVYASSVTFDGDIDGDVNIYADEVTIGVNTEVAGKLTITSATEPEIPNEASIGSYTYNSGDGSLGSGNLSSALLIVYGILSLIAAVAILILTIIIEWIMRRETGIAAEMFRSNKGGFIGAGILFMICVPILAMILVFVIATIYVAVVLVLAICLLSIISVSFTAASFGKLVFRKINRYAGALVMGIILCVISCIPLINIIGSLFTSIYTAGYFGKAFLGRVKNQNLQTPPSQTSQPGM